VIQFRSRKISEPEKFNAEKEVIKKRLLQQKQARTFNALLAQIKNKSDITIKEGFLE